MMFDQFIWLKAAPYIAVIVLISGLGAYGKYEHAGKVAAESKQAKAEKDLTAFKDKIDAAHDAAKAEADARLAIANEVINAQDNKVKAQEDELSKLGITREQTKKELNDALKSSNEMLVSRNNVLDGLNRLQASSGKDSAREGCATSMLQLPTEQHDGASSRVSPIEAAILYEVKDYRSCITQLKAIYDQHNQPIHFTDDAP
jgi:hypothetical protein